MNFFSAAAFLFGLVAGTLCNKAIRIRQFFEWDDALDVRPPNLHDRSNGSYSGS